MIRSILLSTAILGFTAGAALAQGASDPASPNAPAMSNMDSMPMHRGMMKSDSPMSSKASNIESGDTRSRIAPRLPTPAGGKDATAQTYLMDAQRALGARQSGRAQEALERADTYTLTRSVPADAANTPDNSAMVEHIAAARKALGAGDMAAAKAAVSAALQMQGQ